MVTHRGIEVNTDQIKAINNLQPPRNPKEVQKLTGMMTRMFKLQLGKNIEIYIDNMVVKSKLESEHINDLGNIFEILRRHKLRLNASKCSFGVRSGKFLEYIITPWN